MYEDKITKELFEKIRKYNEAIEKILEFSDHEREDPDNDEYRNLSDQVCELGNDISDLLIDTKYFPLVGLTDKQIEDLGCLLKGTEGPSILESFVLKVNEKEFVCKDAVDDDIEKHLDFRLLKLRDEMKGRLRKVRSLPMAAHLDQKTLFFYNEVIRCYLYGVFEASCVLCRAITETLAKRFIEHKGYGELLSGKDKKAKTMGIQEICLKVIKMDENIVALYTKIGNKADTILHQKDLISEDDTLKMIGLLQDFIKRFPAQK